ncbi:hypothetical protein ACFWVF_01550 [Streptomyces sp. NPDC058659]|uniref:hypothetical protein n=1 Tax=unclassified Streptomyces TaxID=2593676 RepID=UPI00364D724F
MRRGELRAGIDCRSVGQEHIAVMHGPQIQWALDPESMDVPARVRSFLARQYAEMAAPRG